MSNTNKLLKDGLTLLSNNQTPEAVEWCKKAREYLHEKPTSSSEPQVTGTEDPFMGAQTKPYEIIVVANVPNGTKMNWDKLNIEAIWDSVVSEMNDRLGSISLTCGVRMIESGTAPSWDVFDAHRRPGTNKESDRIVSAFKRRMADISLPQGQKITHR